MVGFVFDDVESVAEVEVVADWWGAAEAEVEGGGLGMTRTGATLSKGGRCDRV